MKKYLVRNKLTKEDLPCQTTAMWFKFGDTRYFSDKIYHIPVKIKALNKLGEQEPFYTEIPIFEVKAAVPFLLGMNTMKCWKAKIDLVQEKVEVYLESGEEPVTDLT